MTFGSEAISAFALTIFKEAAFFSSGVILLARAFPPLARPITSSLGSFALFILIARVVKVHALNHMHVVTYNNYYARKKGRISATSPKRLFRTLGYGMCSHLISTTTPIILQLPLTIVGG